MLNFQKQDETSPGSLPTDMEGDMLVQMVNKAVTAIMTRLQSTYNYSSVVQGGLVVEGFGYQIYLMIKLRPS